MAGVQAHSRLTVMLANDNKTALRTGYITDGDIANHGLYVVYGSVGKNIGDGMLLSYADVNGGAGDGKAACVRDRRHLWGRLVEATPDGG